MKSREIPTTFGFIMLTLRSGQYQLSVNDDPLHTNGSADNLCQYDFYYRFGERNLVTSRHAVKVWHDEVVLRSCLLSASGGASGIHDRSAIIHDDQCLVAIGPFIAAVEVPTLELKWATQVDDATCFGVYKSQKHNCLISHGELLIARIDYEGSIVWEVGGADIFTNGFALNDDSIYVMDFYDREYKIDIETGRELTA